MEATLQAGYRKKTEEQRARDSKDRVNCWIMRMLQGQVPVATALQQPFQGKHILQGLWARPLTARVADADTKICLCYLWWAFVNVGVLDLPNA